MSGHCQLYGHLRIDGAAEANRSLCKRPTDLTRLRRCDERHFDIGDGRKAILRAQHRMLGKNGDLRGAI